MSTVTYTVFCRFKIIATTHESERILQKCFAYVPDMSTKFQVSSFQENSNKTPAHHCKKKSGAVVFIKKSAAYQTNLFIQMWHCMICPNHECTWCATTFFDLGDAIEHLRKKHMHFIGRPGAVGSSDGHGHIWYCKGCDTDFKDHRSFNSDEAMLAHLRDRHVDSLVHESRIPNISRNGDGCYNCFLGR